MGNYLLIFQWLLLALALSHAAVTPYQPVQSKDGCALIIEGPGRSSSFDRTRSLFYGAQRYDIETADFRFGIRLDLVLTWQF